MKNYLIPFQTLQNQPGLYIKHNFKKAKYKYILGWESFLKDVQVFILVRRLSSVVNLPESRLNDLRSVTARTGRHYIKGKIPRELKTGTERLLSSSIEHFSPSLSSVGPESKGAC